MKLKAHLLGTSPLQWGQRPSKTVGWGKLLWNFGLNGSMAQKCPPSENWAIYPLLITLHSGLCLGEAG